MLPLRTKLQSKKCFFYEERERIYDALPTGKPEIILGDFNAKIGRQETYKPGIGK